MTEMYTDPAGPWVPRETHQYAAKHYHSQSSASNGRTVGEANVRVYASASATLSTSPRYQRRRHDTNRNVKPTSTAGGVSPGNTRRFCTSASCDIYKNDIASARSRTTKLPVPNNKTVAPPGYERPRDHDSARVYSSDIRANGVCQTGAPPDYISPGHVTLASPGVSRVSHNDRTPPPSYYGDDQTPGKPSAYTHQSTANGSTSCLTAEIPLSHIDFWPVCLKRALLACDAMFERFEALVKRANRWLQQFKCYEVVSCETVDKKVIHVKDIYNAAMYFHEEDGPSLATHIKGLRLWYRHTMRTASSSSSSTSGPQELGFLDVTPRYLNPGEKHPRFETLIQMVEKINSRLSQAPLPGEVLSVETVCLKISREDWSDQLKLDPSQCQWYDEFNTHQLNFIRIFYLASSSPSSSTGYHSQQQSIGIRDFTPDTVEESAGIFHGAKHASFSVLFRHAMAWAQRNPQIRITNFQTLDTKHRKKSENHGHRFNTDKLFEYRIEERFRAFYLRVGYVTSASCGIEGPDVSPPSPVVVPPGFQPVLASQPMACRMYLPYKKSSGYENITEMLQRVEAIISDTGAQVYHVETVPIPDWMTQSDVSELGDLDRMFFDGEWYFVSDQDGNDRGPYRYTIIYAIRVYYSGLPMDYGVTPRTSKDKACCVIL